MAFFVIAGKPDCPNFTHAVHVGNYLKEHLPNFELQVIAKRTGKWEPWLTSQNSKHQWYHTTSPLIWKTLTMRRGKPHLIGGLSEFWEYCYDYYGLESLLSKEDTDRLVKDYMYWFNEEKQKTDDKEFKMRNVTIFGAGEMITVQLLPEIFKMPFMEKELGINVKLTDYRADIPARHSFMKFLKHDSSRWGINGQVTIIDHPPLALKDCDLLIVVENLDKHCPEEDDHDLIVRNVYMMYFLADMINGVAKRSLRVILAMEGPLCFAAGILVQACTRIRIRNIVAITSDHGLSMLSIVSEKTKVPIADLGAPPVWGFIGVNEFIDIQGIIQCCNMYHPYKRAVRNTGGSTLPLGTTRRDLRFMTYLIRNPEEILAECKEQKKRHLAVLQRPMVLGKVRAIASVIRIWFADPIPDDIISLGIISTDCFDLPAGLFFSQPAILDKNRIWIPCKDYPFPDVVKEKVHALIPESVAMLDSFGAAHNTTNVTA